jgi:hypothetical protein
VTVAVSCNLSEGVVLAVDSAVTLPDEQGGVAKVFENAEKLFQLGNRPMGMAAFGLGALGSRSIGSFVHEFELLDPGEVLERSTSLEEVVEALRAFFLERYQAEVTPALEQFHEKPFAEIPNEQKPALGLVVGGFSSGEFLSEVWEIGIPLNSDAGSATLRNGRGHFGTTWFAMFEPIRRYVKGFDLSLINELIGYLVARGGDLSDEEQAELSEILERHEYAIPFASMPMTEGIEHARFLAELVVNHHRYAVGAPVVGGRVHVGSVTYRGGRFQIHQPRS